MTAPTTPNLKDLIYQSISESIENMAFMEVTHGEEPPVGDLVWVSMVIDAPIQDCLYLGMPAELLRRLTANMFAMEPSEVGEQTARDTLAELLNTVGGVFCTKLIPQNRTYELGLPEHGKGPFPIHPEDGFYWIVDLEGEPVVLAADGTGLGDISTL